MALEDIGERAKTVRLEKIAAGRYGFLQESADRVMQVITFCAALEVYLRDLSSEEMAVPLTRPHTYVGYGIHVAQRLKKHQSGVISWL